MKAEDIKRLRSLLEKATPGPWMGRPHHDPIMLQGCDQVGLSIAFACGGGDRRRDEFMANAALIAEAITLLPSLLALYDAVMGAPVGMVKEVGGSLVMIGELSEPYRASARPVRIVELPLPECTDPACDCQMEHDLENAVRGAVLPRLVPDCGESEG